MTSTTPQPLTFGLIIGNRGFFPGHLASSGRQEMIAAIHNAGFGVVALDPAQSKFGAVETREEARKCAALFRENRDTIAGVIVSLPNFGDERAIAGPMSYARFSTNDREGAVRGYVGEGMFTNDPLETFGGAGVVQIPRMQHLLRYICEGGFEHHVAANFSTVAAAVHEAATRYLNWNVYWHKEPAAC